MTIPFIGLDPMALDYLGFIPTFLSLEDERPAREQIDSNYQHGGGWRPMEGFTFDTKTLQALYPGDPPLKPMAMAHLRSETIIVYKYGFVLIYQEDGSYEIARVD